VGARASRLVDRDGVPAMSGQNPTNTRNVPPLLALSNHGYYSVLDVGHTRERIGA
ncbi:hypothetical protein Tco_0504021, partial [Tanacetum coccineum]